MSDPRINGHCPACGQDELIMDYATADIRCGGNGCPRPTAAHEILSDRETHHRVTFTDGGFTIRHPLRERLDDALMRCDLHYELGNRINAPVPPGEYRALDHDGRWSFVEVGNDDARPGS